MLIMELAVTEALSPREREQLTHELEGLRKRLKRRNNLLDEVRKAYLRDVTSVREVLKAQGVEAGTTLDLRPSLALFAPAECSFQVCHGTKESLSQRLLLT